MSRKRKAKVRDRAARLAELRQRHVSAEVLSGPEVNIQREVDYIRRCAAEHDARCVNLGALALFSTQSGDAWMLDLVDGLALCLARDGMAQPVRIVKTDTTTAIEWDRTFTIEGDRFCTRVKRTGEVTIEVGYPMQAIWTAIQDGMKAQAMLLEIEAADQGAPADRPRD